LNTIEGPISLINSVTKIKNPILNKKKAADPEEPAAEMFILR